MERNTLLAEFYSTATLAGYYLCRNSGLRTWILCLTSNSVVSVVKDKKEKFVFNKKQII